MENFTQVLQFNSSSRSSSVCPGDTRTSSTLKAVAYSIIIVVSLVGNISVIVAVHRDKVMKKTINLFITNMCVADLVITFVYLPRQLVRYWAGSSRWMVGGTFGYILCKFVPYINHVSVIVSILTLLALSIDRFCAVIFPLKRHVTVKTAKIAIFICWVTALVSRGPYFYVLTLKTRSTKNFLCSANFANGFKDHKTVRQIYYTILLVAFYAVPLVITCVLYSIIVVNLKKRQSPGARQEIFPNERSAYRDNKYRRASRKTTYMLITISLVFSICWGTYFFAQAVTISLPCWLRFWRTFLANSYSALSPCVFFALNSHYRKLLFKSPPSDASIRNNQFRRVTVHPGERDELSAKNRMGKNCDNNQENSNNNREKLDNLLIKDMKNVTSI